jgi:hypothetical protein
MLALLRLRIRMLEVGIAGIAMDRRQVVVRFAPGYRLGEEQQRNLSRSHRRHFYQSDRVVLNPEPGKLLSTVEDMIELIAKGLKETKRQLRV